MDRRQQHLASSLALVAGGVALGGAAAAALAWARRGEGLGSSPRRSRLKDSNTTVVALSGLRGPALLREAFLLTEGVALLNHGSYGTAPRCVLDRQQELREEMEQNPDFWFRWSGGRGTDSTDPRWQAAAEEVARFVGAGPGELVFVPNATAGVHCVLRSLTLTPGDKLLITTQTYPAVRKAAQEVCARAGAELLVLRLEIRHLSDPRAMEELLSSTLDAPESAGRVRLAVLDHITSPTAAVLPVQALARVCRVRNVEVLVDGAHAPGSIVPLDLREVGADYYTGNLHKWVFCPKGTAFLHARPGKAQERLSPMVVSHYQDRAYADRFFMQGTLDYTNCLAVPRALAFLEELGGVKSVVDHNRDLLSWAVLRLVEAWGTKPLLPPEARAPNMAMVEMPLGQECFPGVDLRSRGPAISEQLFVELWTRFQVIVPVIHTLDSGLSLAGFYVRISTQVYNRGDDYERLASAVLQLRKERLRSSSVPSS